MSMRAATFLSPSPAPSSLLHHLNPSLHPPSLAFNRLCSPTPSPLSNYKARKWAAKRFITRAVGETSSPPSPLRQDEQPDGPIYYPGVYGPWTVEDSDVREVVLYRSGLVTAAASFVIASSTTFLPSDFPLSGFFKSNIDLFYALGACGLGLSLFLIHIYVTEIKRTLQALWTLGVVGSLVTYANFAQPDGKDLVEYVLQNPMAVWLIGPLFAALTGLVFKEGLCYGKLEAALLAFIIPSLLLGHLTSLMDDGSKVTLLGIWMTLFIVFAGRKFSQPIKDDIGDKSVFMFNALPEVEKEALIAKLKQQN